MCGPQQQHQQQLIQRNHDLLSCEQEARWRRLRVLAPKIESYAWCPDLSCLSYPRYECIGVGDVILWLLHSACSINHFYPSPWRRRQVSTFIVPSLNSVSGQIQSEPTVMLVLLLSVIGTCESEISVRIEYRIESGGSRLHVQCRLSCESCVFNNV